MTEAQMENMYCAPANDPNKIVIHAMGEIINNNLEDYYAPHWLEKLELSVHAFVTPSGIVIRSVADNYKAFHCKGYNTNSLGVEFLVSGAHCYETFLDAIKAPYLSKAQYNTGVKLVKSWIRKYDVEIDRVFKHSDLDPDRKYDPGDGFPWDRFINDINCGGC